MTFQIEQIVDIEARWPDVWPFLDAGQAFSRGLTGTPRRPNAEAGSLKRLVKSIAAKPTMALLVRDGSAPVGFGMVQVGAGGWSHQESVAHLSSFYMLPESRGSAAVLAMHRQIETWQRGHGLHSAERDTLTANVRAARLWGHLGFQPYMDSLRRDVSKPRRGPWPASADPEADGFSLTRVTDLAADWPQIWPLLRQLDEERQVIEPSELPPNREQFRRQELEKALEGKSRLLLAKKQDAACGIALGTLLKNRSSGLEQLGIISNFFIEKPSRGTRLFWGMLDELEAWLKRKGAEEFETEALIRNRRNHQLWKQIGYRSRSARLRKNLDDD